LPGDPGQESWVASGHIEPAGPKKRPAHFWAGRIHQSEEVEETLKMLSKSLTQRNNFGVRAVRAARWAVVGSGAPD